MYDTVHWSADFQPGSDARTRAMLRLWIWQMRDSLSANRIPMSRSGNSRS